MNFTIEIMSIKENGLFLGLGIRFGNDYNGIIISNLFIGFKKENRSFIEKG